MKRLRGIVLFMLFFFSACYAKNVPSMLEKMQAGWNLGNTLDALGNGLNSETAWGMPRTTKDMIEGLKDSGIHTVRIPVSWALHMNKRGEIDEKWMARVKEVVDWCLECNMFVILNDHHDNLEREGLSSPYSGYYPSYKRRDISIQFITALWNGVASAFKDYDERLIFETVNEPRLRGKNIEWWNKAGDIKAHEGAVVLNEINQAAVDVIRGTGGMNSTRYILVPALRASAHDALGDDFTLPVDSADNRILVSVHMYTPNNFAMASPGEREFTGAHEKELSDTFQALEEKFIKRGIGVVIGEYGAVNKNNLSERVKWFKFFLNEANKRNMPSCLWDNGVHEVGSGLDRYAERFGFYNRKERKWYFPEIEKVLRESGKAGEE